MKVNRLVNTICLLFIAVFLKAQNNNSWIVQSSVDNNVVSLSWYPTDPSLWKQGLISGYTLTRETVGVGSGNFTPAKILPKDAAWFKTNVSDKNGVLYPIGKILYEDNFLQKSNKDNDALQYNYIVYESSIDINVAQAIGLGYVDKNVAKGTTYRYTIRHNQSSQTTSITVKCDEGNRVNLPENHVAQFIFPDGNSLSDMLEMSKPFELKAIIGKARPKMDSVILRWAPTNVEICRNAMEDGYEIWRGRNADSMQLLTTVKPWTEAQLRQMPRQDTMALFAASFVMDKGIPQGIEKANMFDRAAMESNYFGFTLSAADRSQLAADILGFRYVDKTAKFGETYLYDIRTKRLTPNFPVPEIWVTNEFEPLIAPPAFKIEKNEKAVQLKWMTGVDAPYGSYIIERLNPGDTVYHSITKEPIVFITSPTAPNDFHVYVDSLPQNNVTYHYRIKGSNAFGEWSDYAYQTGYGRDITPPKAVSIVSGEYKSDANTIRISWKPNTTDKDLKYQQILMSNYADDNFTAVSGELPATDSVFLLELSGMDIDQSFYFKVMTVDSSGNMSESNPRFVFVPDYDRPEAPAKISAKISPEGLITVNWEKSTSKDVVGYYVFYSNTDPSKFGLVYDKVLNDTTYTWQLDMSSLTQYIYVAVKSEDDNYNRSFLSEILKVRRPDTIPPVSPYLSDLKINNEAVDISWKASASSDVIGYIIYTQNPSDTSSSWTVVDTVANDVLYYSDYNSHYDGEVQYAIKAVDDYGNQSPYSNTGQVYVPFPGHKYAPLLNILSENKNKSVSISWKKSDQPGLDQSIGYIYQVYKSIGSLDVAFYKEIPSSQFSMEDSDLQSGVLYNYAVRVRYNNGWTSELSEIKSILIK